MNGPDIPMTSKLSISVILPVRNEARSLPALLWSLVRQDFPETDFEIIVADGRSTDETRDVVERLAAQSPVTLRLVDNPGIRSGPGRNAGLHVADGEFILFIDGHCHIPSRQLLRDTITLFQQTQADCLCRPQPLVAHPDFPFGASIAAVRASALGHGRDSLIYDLTATGFVDPASSGAAYRRSVFAALGEYDECFDACEDVEFNTRVRKSGMLSLDRSAPGNLLRAESEPRILDKADDALRPRPGAPDDKAPRLYLGRAQLAPAFLAGSRRYRVPALCFHTHARTPGYGLPCVRLRFVLHLGSSIDLSGWRKSGVKFLYRAPAIYFAIHVGLALEYGRKHFAT